MPITSQAEKVSTPADIVATNTPTPGQVLTANGTDFVWATQEAAVVSTELRDFITDIKRRGFTNNAESTLSLTGAQKDTVLLTDAGAGWSYYFQGQKRTIIGNKSIELTGGAGNAHATGLYYVYINTTDGELKVKTAPFNFTDEVLVAAVQWNGLLASGKRALLSDERHTDKIDSQIHKYLHSTQGAKLYSGGEMSDYLLETDTDAAKQPDISEAILADEDLEFTIDALAGGNGQYTIFFRTGANEWGWTEDNDFPYRFTSSGRMNYDNATLTGAEIPSISYANVYHIVTNISGQPRNVFITSQSYYGDVSSAYGASFSDLDIDGLSLPEKYIAHKMTFEINDSKTSQGKCYLERVINYSISSVDVSASSLGVPGLVEAATVDNFVSFSTTNGQQKDSGKKASDFESVLTKGNLTSANNKIGVTGGTAAIIGSGSELTLNESNVVHQNLSGAGTNSHSTIDSHIASVANPHSTSASQVGSPALVSPSVSGNFVSFNGTAGLQQDSGKKATDFEPTLTKGNLTAGSNKILIGGMGTASLIGVGATVDVAEANVVHQNLSGAGTNTHTQIDSHISSSGTMNTQNSNNIAVTGGTMSGVTITGAASQNVLTTGDTMTGRLVTVASSAVDGSGLRLPRGIVPNTLADGDVWNCFDQNTLSAYILALRENMVGTMYSKTNSTTVTASVVSTAETPLLSSGTGIGTLTFPANFLKVGKTIRIKASGLYTSGSTGTPTLVMKFKLGANVLALNTAIKPGTSLTNVEWFIEGDFTVRTVGSGVDGTIIGQALWKPASSTSAFINVPMLNTTAVTMDTTGTLALDITATYSANTVGNSITCTNATIELLN